MATENIMMKAVKKGGDRQQLHERLRQHSLAAAKMVKEEGGENDLIARICADPAFGLTRAEVDALLDPAKFTGRASQQTVEFNEEYIQPILKENAGLLGEHAQLSV